MTRIGMSYIPIYAVGVFIGHSISQDGGTLFDAAVVIGIFAVLWSAVLVFIKRNRS